MKVFKILYNINPFSLACCVFATAAAAIIPWTWVMWCAGASSGFCLAIALVITEMKESNK